MVISPSPIFEFQNGGGWEGVILLAMVTAGAAAAAGSAGMLSPKKVFSMFLCALCG
jgi:hypothetical protein